jgi:Xaa-Pro aminopeptidase
VIEKRIAQLREKMKEKGMDAYLLPTSDFHQSEYVGDYFQTRKYISGFTGSAGVVVVTHKEAGLFTDGRYFIQAAKELENTPITLFKMGEEGVPTIEAFLEKGLEENQVVGFDGRVISAKFGKTLAEKLNVKKIKFSYGQDLVDEIWEDRPALSCEKAFLLDVKYAGQTFSQKLELVRAQMNQKEASMHVMTSLDDIAWFFNIRGRDIPCNPVVLSYAAITKNEVILYIQQDALTGDVSHYLKEQGVTIKAYEAIYEDAKRVEDSEVVLLDPTKVNYALYANLSEAIKKVEAMNPTTLLKAVKNEVEIQNLRNSHLKDGIAFTKFMYWLKNTIGKEVLTEKSASDYLENCRREQEGFIELSFPTISAYKENAAMMHYSVSETSNAVLQQEGMLLVDSGGQYFDGTTDITRTLILGKLTEEEKLHFTTVVRSMLSLANAKFLHGCTGVNLDILARGPLWDLGIDYKCGTGHGIGFLLNVHEGPNGFRWKVVPERQDSHVLEAGMVTTDEPGVYIEGSHGIRIENELVCQKAEKNEYGQFMCFETITYAPIDLDGIEPAHLSEREVDYLNRYHKMVYEKLSPYLTEEERVWLTTYTREIKKA